MLISKKELFLIRSISLAGRVAAKGTGVTPSVRKQPKSVLPGFGLTMGITLNYLSLIVLIPLSTLFLKTFTISWDEFWKIMLSARTLAAFKVSFLTAFYASVIDLIFGAIAGWVLVRYRFPGHAI